MAFGMRLPRSISKLLSVSLWLVALTFTRDRAIAASFFAYALESTQGLKASSTNSSLALKYVVLSNARCLDPLIKVREKV
jgi:hypothetical protein